MKVDDGRVFFFAARETNDATGERFAFLLLYLVRDQNVVI
jgi:hypothetical protein